MIGKLTKEELKQKLIKLQADYQKQLENIAQKDDKVENNYKSDFPDEGRKLDDHTPKEYENYERKVGVEHELELELEKINKALDKLKNDRNYGVCENCSEEIDIERLKARPHALNCIQCKNQQS